PRWRRYRSKTQWNRGQRRGTFACQSIAFHCSVCSTGEASAAPGQNRVHGTEMNSARNSSFPHSDLPLLAGAASHHRVTKARREGSEAPIFFLAQIVLVGINPQSTASP